MKLMANGSVDAVIADLPYGVLNRSNKAVHWDRQIPLEALWEQYRRITKPGSPVILFAQGIFSARLMLSQPRMWRYNLVWRKDRVTGHLNANRMPLRQHEDIIVFYDRQPVYHPQMNLCHFHTQGTQDRSILSSDTEAGSLDRVPDAHLYQRGRCGAGQLHRFGYDRHCRHPHGTALHRIRD